MASTGSTVSQELDGIEQQLTQAAEALMTGALSEQLHTAACNGVLLLVPMPRAPKHIVVLKRIKQWKEDELLSEAVCEQVQQTVLSASHPAPAPVAASVPVPENETPKPETPCKREHGQLAIYQFEGVKKLSTSHRELQEQRERASRGEDYTPVCMIAEVFDSENVVEVAEAPAARFPCSECNRIFPCPLSLRNHAMWHGGSAPPIPITQAVLEFEPVPTARVTVGPFSIEGGSVSFAYWCHINGRPIDDIREEAEQKRAAQAARQQRHDSNKRARMAARVAAEAALTAGETGDVQVEGRCGSKRRGSYTAKFKLKVLDFYDVIFNDPALGNKKIKSFEADARSRGVPWSTVTGKTGWARPAERARLSKACAKEHRQSLLRIDRDPLRRRKGMYHAMELKVFQLFKARRARGRKVSPRWLTATSKKVMKEMHPHVPWEGSYNWRRRFAKRFHIGQKRKSNVKNKTWEQSEPVILRFLATLRKRLQLGDNQLQDNEVEVESEPEPEDENPAREEEEVLGDERPLDSSDDEASNPGDLITFEDTLPASMRAAPLPPLKQLEFKHASAQELKGRAIMYNWTGTGWWLGKIRRPSADKNKMVKLNGQRQPANLVYCLLCRGW